MLPSSQSPLVPASKPRARGAAVRPAAMASAVTLAVLAPLLAAGPASAQGSPGIVYLTHDRVVAQDEATGCVSSVTVLGPHRDPDNSFGFPQAATQGNGKTVFSINGRTLSWEGEAGLNDENLQGGSADGAFDGWVRQIFVGDMQVSVDGAPHGSATGAPAATLVPQTASEAMPTDPAQYAASWSGSVSGLSVGTHTISMKPSYLAATQLAENNGDRRTTWFKGGSTATGWESSPTDPEAGGLSIPVESAGDVNFEVTICPAVTPPVTETATATATVTQTVTTTETKNVTSTVESTVTETAPGTTSWLTAPGSTTTVTGPGSTETATKTVVVDAEGNPADEGLAKTGIGPWTPWLALGGLAAAAIGCVFAIRRRADHA